MRRLGGCKVVVVRERYFDIQCFYIGVVLYDEEVQDIVMGEEGKGRWRLMEVMRF